MRIFCSAGLVIWSLLKLLEGKFDAVLLFGLGVVLLLYFIEEDIDDGL